MNTPKSIMVVISGSRNTHSALERAFTFAPKEDLHIHLFNVVYEAVTDLGDTLSLKHSEEMKEQYIADRYLFMNQIAETLIDKGIKVEVEVKWHHLIHEAIEEAVSIIKPDLVIKAISADSSSKNPFAMHTDQHLLRYCPGPLLLVREAHWANTPICLAIDPEASDQDHIDLNHRIIEYGKMLGKMTDCDINVVASFSVPSLNPDIGMYGVDYEVVHEDKSKVISEKLAKIMKLHAIAKKNAHVIEGKPERVFAKFIDKTHSQLLILGTVGRSGLSALFIGNTAERILAELDCDILALKPPNR